jgi:putative DNA primase/helicase
MRTYDYVDFLPQQQATRNVYNTFNGFAAESIKKSKKEIDIENSLMMKHIKNLCNNEEKVYNYVLKFLGRKVQKPYLLTRTALLFKGLPGCGKDTLFEWFGNKILGSDYYYCGAFVDIFGRFNKNYIDKKVLVVVSETGGKETFENEDTIKLAITRPKNKIEEKSQKSYETTNNIGYAFLTNSEAPLNIRFEDRRFCAIECNVKIANNKDYFDGLYIEMDSNEYNRAWYDYFMNMDIPDNYDFINERPQTTFYNDCQKRNIPILAKFFENEILQNNKKVSCEYFRLYEVFAIYMKEKGYKFDYTETKLGIDMKHYNGIEKKRTSKGVKYVVDFVKLKADLIQKKYIEDFKDDEIEFVEDDIMSENGLDV